jgi:multiple sugar transport system ATP-binding protein
MATVEFAHLTKRFENGFVAVDDFSLAVSDGELLVLVGPSGCGKSTVLRMLAGLDDPTEGEVLIDSIRMNEAPPRDRDIAMVFQSYALYPHLTVRENIEFGLKIHRLPEEEIAERVKIATDLLGLGEVLDRKPKQLSGGQRQRVAMGRALVREPKVFLLDEPLSNLDAKLRVHMRTEIAMLQQRLGVTMLYVTHDQVEAMTMGDRVAVMRAGQLLQVGTPKEIYNTPVNAFVAAFIGSPAMNMAEGTVRKVGENFVAVVGSQTLSLPSDIFVQHPALKPVMNAELPCIIGIRPEDFEDATLVPVDSSRTLRAHSELVEELGSQTMVHFNLDAPSVSVEGEDVIARPFTAFVGTFSAHTNVVADTEIAIAVDSSRMHFFDIETGLRL